MALKYNESNSHCQGLMLSFRFENLSLEGKQQIPMKELGEKTKEFTVQEDLLPDIPKWLLD